MYSRAAPVVPRALPDDDRLTVIAGTAQKAVPWILQRIAALEEWTKHTHARVWSINEEVREG